MVVSDQISLINNGILRTLCEFFCFQAQIRSMLRISERIEPNRPKCSCLQIRLVDRLFCGKARKKMCDAFMTCRPQQRGKLVVFNVLEWHQLLLNVKLSALSCLPLRSKRSSSGALIHKLKVLIHTCRWVRVGNVSAKTCSARTTL